MGPAAHDCLEHFGHTVLVVDLHGQVCEGVLEPRAVEGAHVIEGARLGS